MALKKHPGTKRQRSTQIVNPQNNNVTVSVLHWWRLSDSRLYGKCSTVVETTHYSAIHEPGVVASVG